MKILHIPNAYFPVVGGTERNCQCFSELLVEQGHDVRVLTANVGAVEGYYRFGVPAVASLSEVIGGVRVIRLPYINALYGLGGCAETRLHPQWLGKRIAGRIMRHLRRRLADMIAREIAEMRPDVVMTMPHLVANVEAVLAARRRIAFPLVIVPMLHEHDPNWDHKAVADALRFADAVVALTSHEVDRLATAYHVPKGKIFLASVGVDLDPTYVPSVPPRQQVVFLGRKIRSKGVSDLIAAMKVVWATWPNAELVLAGIRTSETTEIDHQIAGLPEPLRNRVQDVGSVAEAEKIELLRSACCLVLPSKVESFGMVILDAWAQARPVIVWDLPVFRSIVENGRTGLLVNPEKGVDGLAEAIVKLLANAEAANRMGLQGYQQAKTAYSWRAVAEKYLQAYEYAICHSAIAK